MNSVEGFNTEIDTRIIYPGENKLPLPAMFKMLSNICNPHNTINSALRIVSPYSRAKQGNNFIYTGHMLSKMHVQHNPVTTTGTPR